MPHDAALTPSVDPSISQIPAVNSSGSYYDGMMRSLASLSRCLGCISADWVYAHMDLNTQARWGCSHLNLVLSNTCSSRYIGRGDSFHFTGSIWPPSKCHSRGSAAIRGILRTGIGLSVTHFRLCSI